MMREAPQSCDARLLSSIQLCREHRSPLQVRALVSTQNPGKALKKGFQSNLRTESPGARASFFRPSHTVVQKEQNEYTPKTNPLRLEKPVQ